MKSKSRGSDMREDRTFPSLGKSGEDAKREHHVSAIAARRGGGQQRSGLRTCHHGHKDIIERDLIYMLIKYCSPVTSSMVLEICGIRRRFWVGRPAYGYTFSISSTCTARRTAPRIIANTLSSTYLYNFSMDILSNPCSSTIQ